MGAATIKMVVNPSDEKLTKHILSTGVLASIYIAPTAICLLSARVISNSLCQRAIPGNATLAGLAHSR